MEAPYGTMRHEIDLDGLRPSSGDRWTALLSNVAGEMNRKSLIHRAETRVMRMKLVEDAKALVFPPLFLLVIGFGLGCALRGFRRSRN